MLDESHAESVRTVGTGCNGSDTFSRPGVRLTREQNQPDVGWNRQ